MSKFHQGAAGTVIRDAHAGDTGFGGGMTHVLFRYADGSEKLVPRDEVTEVGPTASSPQTGPAPERMVVRPDHPAPPTNPGGDDPNRDPHIDPRDTTRPVGDPTNNPQPSPPKQVPHAHPERGNPNIDPAYRADYQGDPAYPNIDPATGHPYPRR